MIDLKGEAAEELEARMIEKADLLDPADICGVIAIVCDYLEVSPLEIIRTIKNGGFQGAMEKLIEDLIDLSQDTSRAIDVLEEFFVLDEQLGNL